MLRQFSATSFCRLDFLGFPSFANYVAIPPGGALDSNNYPPGPN